MALERKKDFRESDFEVNKNSKKICFQIFFLILFSIHWSAAATEKYI